MFLGALTLDQMMGSWGHEFAEMPEPYRSQLLARAQPGMDLYQSGVYGGDYGFKPHPTMGGRSFTKTYPGGTEIYMAYPGRMSAFLAEQSNGVYPGTFLDGAPKDAFEEFVYRDRDDNEFYYVRVKPSYLTRYTPVLVDSDRDRYQMQLREPNQWSAMAANNWIQVARNPLNGSWLSIGAQGGYRDPRLLHYDTRFGVVTPVDNYLNQKDGFWEVWGGVLTVFAAVGAGVAAAGAGGAAGAGATAGTTAGEAAVGIGGVGGSGLTAAEMAALEYAAAAEIATGGISAAGAAGYGVTATAVEAGLAAQTAAASGGWVSAEGGAGYSGGAAADASALTTAPVTESGWVSAEGGAGYSGGAPVDATAGSIAPSGYQSPPSPDSGLTSTSSNTATSGSTAGSGITTSQITKGASLIKSIISAASGGGDNQTAGGTILRPSQAPSYWADFDASAVESEAASGEAQSVNWWWLLVAGAAGYALMKKRKGGKRHARQ